MNARLCSIIPKMSLCGESRLLDKVWIAEATYFPRRRYFLHFAFFRRHLAHLPALGTSRRQFSFEPSGARSIVSPRFDRSLLQLSWATKPLWNPTNSIAAASAVRRSRSLARSLVRKVEEEKEKYWAAAAAAAKGFLFVQRRRVASLLFAMSRARAYMGTCYAKSKWEPMPIGMEFE